jgi:hypothetical protein
MMNCYFQNLMMRTFSNSIAAIFQVITVNVLISFLRTPSIKVSFINFAPIFFCIFFICIANRHIWKGFAYTCFLFLSLNLDHFW